MSNICPLTCKYVQYLSSHLLICPISVLSLVNMSNIQNNQTYHLQWTMTYYFLSDFIIFQRRGIWNYYQLISSQSPAKSSLFRHIYSWSVNQHVFKYPQCVMRTRPLTAVLLRYISQSENAWVTVFKLHMTIGKVMLVFGDMNTCH
jgi:hypothetical protein